jgi:hypothetical protein
MRGVSTQKNRLKWHPKGKSLSVETTTFKRSQIHTQPHQQVNTKNAPPTGPLLGKTMKDNQGHDGQPVRARKIRMHKMGGVSSVERGHKKTEGVGPSAYLSQSLVFGRSLYRADREALLLPIGIGSWLVPLGLVS